MALITLTTDFGRDSSYVAAMKGSIWSEAPNARIVDLSHSIPPQNIIAAGLFLRETLPWYPSGCIHLVVVDPGVGTDRAILKIDWRDAVIIAPDNGCWTAIVPFGPVQVSRIDVYVLARTPTSNTFHGRDVIAPAAARLWNGQSVPCHPVTQWQNLNLPTPRVNGQFIEGEVLTEDNFGNLLTNIPQVAIHSDVRVTVGNQNVGPHCRTYGDASPGQLISLISSSGYLEIAVVNGSAGRTLNLEPGAKVVVGPA